ncbi:hypothetical protein FSS13T_27220 [Flavobacterium saliperosum S13]|nr:DUF1643 domain-containing protein [Flavobacterium saliperosum]ESU21271.1 hypothetical protein FSS13T_27220 [Flavobacterium saliperosum S13]
MTKPVYKHPTFVIDKKYYRTDLKRYWLELTIDNNSLENLLVIMKNPSRATLDVSDKTVFNVCNYVHKNRKNIKQLKNVGKITILNLIPHFETYSKELKKLGEEINDLDNLEHIRKYTSENSKVIIAWGNHPSGLFKEYELIKNNVLQILKENRNEVFYVEKLSKYGNPKHAQVWSYNNDLLEYK